MNSQPTAHELLHRAGQAISMHLAHLPQRWPDAPPKLVQAMQYSLLAGGKRLRPALVLETCRACGGEASSRLALDAATAMELIHTFSLVHDDLPAMDDDDLRRGRATNHKVFGEAMAILAGDAMMAAAFEILADADAGMAPKLIRELAAAAGAGGMIGGQALDIASEHQSLSLAQLQRIHAMKTGALLTASCRMGAICAGASANHLAAVTTYARHVGLAFQIVDDLLDVTATREQLGKSTQKDAHRGKNTYPALLGVSESRATAATELQTALTALHPLGAAASGLAELAKFIVDRST